MNLSNTPKQAMNVTYFPSVTVYGSLPGRLEITEQGTLKLTTVEGTAEEPVYAEVFNLAPTAIKKVSSMLDSIKVFTEQKSYRVSVSEFANIATPIGGVVGMAAAQKAYENTNADAFLKELEAQGVPVTRIGYGKVWGIALIAAAVMIVVVILLSLILDA